MLLAAILLMSTGGQVPATASPPIWGGPNGGVPETIQNPRPVRSASGHGRILERTEDSIDAALRDGSLSDEDARGFRTEARRIRALATRYRANGLTRGESGNLRSLALSLQGLVQARRSQRDPG